MKTTAVLTLAAVASFLGFAQPSDAALLYTLQNVGSDMVLSSSGSLNIADAVPSHENPASPCADAPGTLNEFSICVGQPDVVQPGESPYSRYKVVPPQFGSVSVDLGGLNPFFFPPDELTGMFSEIHLYTDAFFVSKNYVSGTPLIGTARWHNREWAGFGIVPDQSGLVGQLLGAEDEVVDTISFLVVVPTTVVPLPATSLLLFTGIGALMVLRRRRSANSPNSI